jgi:tetratricopeptide (TPR) repeat protein
VQAVSLLGDTWGPPSLDPAAEAARHAALIAAREAYERHPADADSIIWYGRRLAYRGNYRGAIAVFSWGIERHPADARLFRHRGHRYITVRDFDRAIEDLLHATRLTANTPDRIEPDGLPNARGIPTSTLKTNIWYHLGLVHYLRGDFPRAASAYRECLRYADNPDMDVAARYWLNVTLRRLGSHADAADLLAAVTQDQDIIENQAYHRLLLMYKGVLASDTLLAAARTGDALASATLGYGIANWLLTAGDTATAVTLMREIRSGAEWPAFGFLAAEADLARLPRAGSES